jgi:dTMP kinase
MRLSPQFILPSEQDEGAEETRIDLAGTRRFEKEPLAFHDRVRAGYLKMAKQEPERWCVIDAVGPVDEISETIWERVSAQIRLNVADDPPATGPTLPLWAGQSDSSTTDSIE